jgi:hypothetical protein
MTLAALEATLQSYEKGMAEEIPVVGMLAAAPEALQQKAQRLAALLAEAGMEGEEFSWNDDGTWLWETTSDELMNSVLPAATIRSGVSMPGYASIDFQKKIDDNSTLHVVESLLRLKSVDSLPYPMVYLTAEQQNRVDELIVQITKYAEYQMVWFVVGDVELNVETWADFCAQVKALGVDELVQIWQTAADNQR